ncbi:hypothetical protein V3C99_016877, partial [Haemonchus contortus]|uniref:Conserved plasma membrane protein n=1 Tax=Haemonchus contortus TaxID=6289 RepID=A0A7I4YYM1_HAECO
NSFLDPLVTLSAVASIICVLGRFYTVWYIATGTETIKMTVKALVVLAVPLNICANVVKCIDARYTLSSTMPLYVGVQSFLIFLEFLFVLIVYISDNTFAISFIFDLAFITFLTANMELVVYLIDRSLRALDREEDKKEL